MDAIKFLEEKERMCKYYRDINSKISISTSPCTGCPFEEAEQGITTSCCAYSNHMWLKEDYVKAVEEWSNKHYVPTNKEMFKEVYGFYPVMTLLPNDPWWERNYEKTKGGD